MHEMTNEPVIIDLHNIKGLSWYVNQATVMHEGSEVPSQLDDMNGDYRADELVFLTDIAAKETLTFHVMLNAEGQQNRFIPRVYAHMSISSKENTAISAFEALGTSNVFNNLYHHGACFESELVGYRIYSDSRQNVDIYGKKTYRLELPTTKFNTTAKQLEEGYGHDALWNGKSIACGTLRDWNGGVQEITDVKRRGQRILAYGPLRTVVEMTDFGWHGNLCCRTRYTFYAGHRDMMVEAVFDELLPPEQFFCTGVQKIGTTPQGFRENGITASWGTDWPDYGKKDLYPQQSVGLAVYVPDQYIYKETEDSLNYLCILHAPEHNSFHYWISCCADMEKDGYHTATDWFAFLPRWRERLKHPLKVEYTVLTK